MALLGLLISLAALFFLIALGSRLLYGERDFYFSPSLSMLQQATDPILQLASAGGWGPRSKRARIWLAMGCILLLRGILLAYIAPSSLLFSLASHALNPFLAFYPLPTSIFLSILWVVDSAFVLSALSLAISALLEPYTTNPISRLALSLFEWVQDLASRLIPKLQSLTPLRLWLAAILILLNAIVAGVLILTLNLLLDGPFSIVQSLLIGLNSALVLLADDGIGFFSLLILISALLSWFKMDPNNPLVRFVEAVSQPLLAPLRRAIPPIAGLDLSPIAAMLLLELTRRYSLEILYRIFAPWT